jgi:uncharacterized protein
MDERRRIGGTDFVWNSEKAAATWRRRGIRFEDAATVFMDPLIVVVDAGRKGEDRDAVIGFDKVGRLLCVVHIEVQGDAIRIISARRAGRREESLYAQ